VGTRLATGYKASIAVLLVAAAVHYVLVELHRPQMPATDTYTYFLPNVLHTVRSLGQGGKGLLWNPFQSCGGPFFANGVIGVLNPQYLPFLLLDPNTAVHVVLIVDMVIGAVGMLLLARQLGLGWVAALGGALVFELGDPMAQFAGWNPMITGAWVWVPWALLCCERLFVRPGRGDVLALAAVLTLQLLTGIMHTVALTYQLIAFRIAWEIVARRGDRPWRGAVYIAIGLALAPLAAAIQLFPYIEFASESFRIEIPVDEMLKLYSLQWSTLQIYTKLRAAPVPFLVAPLVLAALAPFVSATRRLAVFYVAIGILFALFALGDLTPLVYWYAKLPPGGRVIRVPNRLFWITGLSITFLAAFGLQLLAERGNWPRRRWAPAVVAIVSAAALGAVAPGGLRSAEMLALAVTVTVVLAIGVRPGLAPAGAWIVLAAVALNLVAVPLRWKGRLLPSIDRLWTHAQTFAALDPPLSAQDRVFVMPDFTAVLSLELFQRTATLLEVSNLSDYETIPRRHFADYFTMMRRGQPLTTIQDGYSPYPWLTADMRSRLLDLAAVRYLIASPGIDLTPVSSFPRVPVAAPNLQVHRNDSVLPRARYVPRIEIVSDPGALLQRLAFGTDDPEALALVEENPPSGFTGVAGAPIGGEARFVTNDPEHLVIDVEAPERGFLLLADQHYPGWRATVNGAAAPILRANYLFRLVEVPAGPSRVEFRYRPGSLMLGAAVSGLTLAAVALALLRRRGRI
jgi:hypothetical protein